MGQEDLGIVLGVGDYLLDPLALFYIRGQDHQGLVLVTMPVGVGLEELGDFPTPGLDRLGVDPLHPEGRGARPRVELADVQHSKLVMSTQLHGLFPLGVRLPWEPTDDVGRQGDVRHFGQ